jgi:hypothetical protein
MPYPNPVSGGLLTVTARHLKQGDKIELYNMQGSLAGTYEAAGETTLIDLSRLPPGAYLMLLGKGRVGRIVVGD